MLTKAYIPYKAYYASPFSRWQMSMANEHAIVLGAGTARRWLTSRQWDPKMFEYLILGMTIGQPQWFYGGPWAAALVGAPDIPGVLVSQACTTSTTCIYQAAVGVETGMYDKVLTLMTDRCSNGQHAVWPNPNGPGGEVIHENWLMDNFGKDPWAGQAMIQTAENVSKETGLTREECDAVTLRRYEQYLMGTTDNFAFQKRYMFPVEVAISKKKTLVVDKDEGITPCTQEGLATLKPVIPGGVHTFGAQTHPADGNCALIVTTRDKARELSADPKVDIQVLSYGYSRAKKAHMAMAVVPAARMALEKAGLGVKDMKTIKTHNPFAANDLFFAKQFGIDVMGFNNYGCPMIYGHPQGPTAGRCIIEGIEETAMLGGGYLLWAGCAAGDTGAAMVLKIG